MPLPLTEYIASTLRDSAGGQATGVLNWWRGSPVTVRATVLTPDASAVEDISDFTALKLRLTGNRNGRPHGDVWWTKTVLAADFDTPTLTEWEAREAWHAGYVLEAADLALPVSGTHTDYWALLYGIDADDQEIPLAARIVRLRATGSTLPDAAPGAPWITAAEVAATYATLAGLTALDARVTDLEEGGGSSFTDAFGAPLSSPFEDAFGVPL